jgi:HK97 family phage major capsid protein
MTAEGFWLPAEVLSANMQRSYIAGTGTLGGMLVQTTNEGSQFIDVLRNKAQVMALGARSLMLSTPVTIPRRAASGTTNWLGETVASTLGVGNFEQITLTPKGISANQQYAKQLLITNDPSIDALVRDDITQIIGLAIDLAALHGTGTLQPTGIIGTSSIGSVLLATNGLTLGNATAYPAMVSLETLVSSANADVGSLAYLMRPAARGALRVAQRFSSTDSPVWTNGGPFVAGIGGGLGNGSNDGLVNGYRAGVTSQIANNLTTGTATTISSPVFYGNFSELLLGHFNGGATDIIVDPYSAGANAVVRIYARHWVDIGVRHAASFAVLGGVLSV